MKKMVLLGLVSASCFGFGMSNTAQAQKWADLTMTVLLDGDAPEPKKLNKAADPMCNQAPANSDELVIDPKTKGIANIVFMIDTKTTKLEPNQIHPDLKDVPATKPVLDNLQCKFVPHVMAMRTGQTLSVKNSDTTSHNAKFNFFENEEVNPVIPSMQSKDILTKKDEKVPTKVDCNIHPWMNAYVIVVNHPYVGISDTAGKIKIEKLPAGIELDFKIWHEVQNKSIEEVNVGGKKETWKKGTVKLTLKEGANDLGTVLLKPDRFKK